MDSLIWGLKNYVFNVSNYLTFENDNKRSDRAEHATVNDRPYYDYKILIGVILQWNSKLEILTG